MKSCRGADTPPRLSMIRTVGPLHILRSTPVFCGPLFSREKRTFILLLWLLDIYFYSLHLWLLSYILQQFRTFRNVQYA